MNKNVRCLIVDDEPLARNVIEQYISEVAGLQLVNSCSGALEAMDAIRKEEIDLVFLDINMPQMTGLNLVRTLSKPPLIIFTTAYSQYAVDGFELDALDYLVKPIDFERFLKAVNKAFIRLDEMDNKNMRMGKQNFISIKSDKKIHKLDLDKIQYIQAYGDYVKINYNDTVIVTHKTMKDLDMQLSGKSFLRIHKSFIVNLLHIRYLEGNQAMVGDEKLPVGMAFKEQLMKALSLTSDF